MYELCKIEHPKRAVFMPATDIHEVDEGLTMTIDLPGVGKDDLELSIEGAVLKIHGKVAPDAPADASVVYREYRDGDFFRSFIIGDEFALDEIEASLDAGVLTLTIPRAERPKPRRIEIEES